MNLLQSFARSRPTSRSLIEYMNFNGNTYPIPIPQQTMGFTQEEISPSFVSLAASAYKGNSVVFAILERRRQVFSQATFKWRRVRGGTPGELFGTSDLSILERPRPGWTTGDLLSQVINHADLAGNAFIVRRGSELRTLRPDWITIVAASKKEPGQGLAAIDAEVIGYAYYPGGKSSGQEPEVLLPEEVAHFMPTPDPEAEFRGMSWLSAAIREIMGDSAATTHKIKFFEQGATPNMVVSLDPAIPLEKFNAWVDKFDERSSGVMNAYRTMYLGGGADVKVVGADLKQLDFKITQGAGETRIAAAGSVPAIIAGLSEGLQSATYSNYGQARRAFSDGTLWDLWRNIAGSLERIVPPPGGAQLWVDTRSIPFLQEDEKDRAEIQQMDAAAINTLVTAGYDPVSVVDAVVSGDLKRLVHSGLYSVQLQEPGTDQPDQTPQQAQVDGARAALILEGIARPTQEQLAERLGVSERTVRRWMSGVDRSVA